jgi:hypothetical protein
LGAVCGWRAKSRRRSHEPVGKRLYHGSIGKEIAEMASIFINSLYLLGSIMALGLGVMIVKAVIDTLRKK